MVARACTGPYHLVRHIRPNGSGPHARQRRPRFDGGRGDASVRGPRVPLGPELHRQLRPQAVRVGPGDGPADQRRQRRALAGAVAHGDTQAVEAGEHVELCHRQRGHRVQPHRVAKRHEVDPAAAALAAGGGPELDAALANLLGLRAFDLGWERAGSHPGDVGLGDTPDLVYVLGPHTRADAGRTRDGVRGGYERIGAVVYVEQCPLSPLEQDVLAGVEDPSAIFLNPLDWYEENRIVLHAGVRIVGVDRFAREVTAHDGTVHPYDKLIIATGSRPFIPPIKNIADAEGNLRPGVFGFLTLDDCNAIVANAADAKNAAVIGGGLPGLAAALGLLTHGRDAGRPGDAALTRPGSRLRGVYYGWWIVVAWAVLNIYFSGTRVYGLTAFFTPVRQSFGWSAALLSLTSSLANVLPGPLAPASRAWFHRPGPRPTRLTGRVCSAPRLAASSTGCTMPGPGVAP